MSTFAAVEEMVGRASQRIERRIGEAKALAAQGQKSQQEAEEYKAQVIACEEAVAFLNSFADERQTAVQKKIETLVTHGVQTIFGDDMTFHVISEQKANRTEVTFSLRSMMGDETVETPILDARGGGVAAVVGFLLRLIVTMLRDERPLLVMDETFAQLSADYEPRLAEFIRELVDQTGVQILMVTHSEVYSEHADKVYRFGQKKGETTVALASEVDTPDE
jgi:ABC-type cobalamin/Fe3+-siderophores transport system ATPase subunit